MYAIRSYYERTIRFYVARHLVAAPEGRGTAATYSYRHLHKVLAIKLRQMEGVTLSRIAEELAVTTGDVLERRVAGTDRLGQDKRHGPHAHRRHARPRQRFRGADPRVVV